ncbi:MAG: alpha/beta hydrolase [Acidobacteriota bacterium]
MPPEARCGTYEVFENRAARTGRKIPLHVVVLPAAGPERLPDPFVYFAGGPGEASIPWGFWEVQQLPTLRQRRDVLLIDLRGTGMSDGLFCEELKGSGEVQDFLDDFLATDKLRACRDRLGKERDLSWYTTDAAVDDVEEVRTALGYGPLNLMGVSFGTRAALTYLRRHPGSVRTATLNGVVRPDERYPLGTARYTQDALDGLIAECQGDPACRGSFPALRQDMDAVLRRATAEPVQVELTDPETGQPAKLRLTRTGLAQTLRYMLYSAADAARLPLEVHLAAQGDWKPLALTARLQGSIFDEQAEGFFQSVTCAEDVAFIRDDEVAAAVAGTFLGDFRVRRQKEACTGWPTRDLGADLQSPVVSDVPALLLSGERDPATPAANGERVARTLKRSRHVVIPDAAHGTDGMEGEDCESGLIAAFIDAGAAEGLDTSCVAKMRRPDFVLTLGDPEVKVARIDLERLTGSYVGKKNSRPTARVDIIAGRVRFGIGQGPRYLLIPTSPTRFRVEGLPPGHKVTFQVPEGRATGLILSQPGRPDLEMTRSE